MIQAKEAHTAPLELHREEGRRVSLAGLSGAQRRLVERHLPLVHLSMRRTGVLARRRRTGREYRDLFQEGALCLAEAVRSHDPARHGEFAAFAMARIRFAVSRYAQENNCLIRVPLITQRRSRSREAGAAANRAGRLPRIVYMSGGSPPPRRRSWRGESSSDSANSDGTIERGRLGERIETAILLTLRQMKASSRSRTDYRRLIDICAEERWLVPEPESRTPLRDIARRLDCSIGRITRCERLFRAKVAERLTVEGIGSPDRKHPAARPTREMPDRDACPMEKDAIARIEDTSTGETARARRSRHRGRPD